jgi:hypothetical protein
MQALINDFMNSFYGYGNLNGPYWFIGMEEGCGSDWNTDVQPRFAQWRARGSNQTEHLRDFHFAIGVTQHWEGLERRPVKVQFTWRRLIETILAARGDDVADESVATYQAVELGTLDGQSCLLELLPLPSPNVKGFGYEHLANEDYPYFASRRLYRKHIMDARIANIRGLIADNKPRHVVLYGKSYQRRWDELVMGGHWDVDTQVQQCRLFESSIWLVPHPAAHKIPRDLFVTLGEKMRQADQEQRI